MPETSSASRDFGQTDLIKLKKAHSSRRPKSEIKPMSVQFANIEFTAFSDFDLFEDEQKGDRVGEGEGEEEEEEEEVADSQCARAVHFLPH